MELDKEGKRMKKGYYVHFQGRTSIGVSKKIDMQLKEFRRFYDMEEMEVETVQRNLFQRILGLFPAASIKRDYENALESMKQPDFIYVRRAVADRAYVKFWKEIKKKYPRCKIIIEIFTYPYDKDDFGKWNAWPFYIKELIYRRKLKKYVDRFVTYSDDDVIFNIPTIRTTNGVNVDDVSIINGEFHKNQLTMIGVAYMQRQHGYERIIKGMGEYYRQGKNYYKIFLKLVGDGPEKKGYQELAQKYDLGEYVKFYPTTTGEQLDKLYDQSELALGVFGMYKVGYKGPVGAIKTRECLAKGIPMVSGSPVDVMDGDSKYIKIFPNDDSSVNMKEIIDFYEALRKEEKSKRKLAEKLRNFARQHVSMEVVMKPIEDYINEEDA